MAAGLEAHASATLTPVGTTGSGHVIYEGASSRQVLLIVFAFVDQPVGTRSHSTFLRDVDCKKLFLNPGVNAWYQTGVPGAAPDWAGLLDYLRGIKAQHADHEILCLGHSMGGYAALGLGLGIGANRILASVPEYRLNLSGSISSRHLGTTVLQCADLGPVLAANRTTDITLVYGRENLFDAAMARGIAERTRATLISLPCGHNTFPHLKERQLLAEMLAAFVDERPIVVAES